jgi:hypothetical protein
MPAQPVASGQHVACGDFRNEETSFKYFPDKAEAEP